ncbi:Nn.00g101720.m01.CDS01 [Neocucurbitaria sp. VM-36]
MSVARVDINVNGQHGAQRRSQSTGQDLVRVASRFHGADALPAKNGRNAGSIKVELQLRQGGSLIAFDPDTGSSRQVCIGQNLYLSAKGGNGEDGGTGGAGATGSKGYDGQNATEHSEATRGGDGGPGGNGGCGSSGGHGGHGGTVELRVSEYNMHLAYVVEWSIRGGVGGRAGQHGRAGEGGKGGRGGRGCSWQEFDGYKQVCAPDCGYGTSTAVTSPSAGTSSIGSLRSDAPLYLAIQNGAISDGQNTYALRNVGAYIPASYAGMIHGALASTNNNQALIQSSSSRAFVPANHSSGCQRVAKYKTHSRPSASNGSNGPRGRSPASPLYPGNSGDCGHGSVIIYDPQAPLQARYYGSKFEFRLCDFDIADENHDGIFEPGECILINALQIENANRSSNGMPTPFHTSIPASLNACEWLQIVQGRDTVSLPRNIAPRQTKTTTTGIIWAKIKSPPQRCVVNGPFIAYQEITLSATIPNIDRPVNNFNHSKTIIVRYPFFMETGQIKYIASIPFGSSCSIKWPVGNCSSQALGSESSSRREIKSRIETESLDAILSDALIPNPRSGSTGMAEESIAHIGEYQTHEISKRLHITEFAAEYSKITSLIHLCATTVASLSGHHRSLEPMITMQTHENTMQVTNRYHHDPNSKFLLLTSTSTTKGYLDGWRRFMRAELHSTADIWNVSQHGGVRESSGTGPVLDNYTGKTIVALDDPFDFQNASQRTIFDFIEAESSYSLTQNRTSFAFVKQGDVHRESAVAKLNGIAWALAASGKSARHSQSVAIHASTKTELLDLLNNRTTQPKIYTVDISGNPERHGHRLARRLRRLHPRDLFIVTNKMDESGLIILQCNPQGQNFRINCVGSRNDSSGNLSGLSLTEAYTLVSSMPFPQRLDILHESATVKRTYSDFVLSAAKLSIMQELHDQVTCLASRPGWSHTFANYNCDRFHTNAITKDSHVKVAMLLSHDMCRPTGHPTHHNLSNTTLELLSSVILSARCQGISQILTKIFSPLRRTRSDVKRVLLSQMEHLMERNGMTKTSTQLKDEFKAFKKRAKQKFAKTNHGDAIFRQISLLTNGQVQPSSKSHANTWEHPIDSVFPKTVYVSMQELGKWHRYHDQAEAQQRSDRELIADLKTALDLEVHPELRELHAESRSLPSPTGRTSPTLPFGTFNDDMEETIADEVTTPGVSRATPFEMHTSTPITRSPPVSGSHGTANERGDADRADSSHDAAQPLPELMSPFPVPELSQDNRQPTNLMSRSPLSELPQDNLQPELQELMSTSPIPELQGTVTTDFILDTQA